LILEFGSFAVFADVSFFFIPLIREQNDFLRFADFDPFFNLEGSVVTASERFDP
jgi:hypothetical protein